MDFDVLTLDELRAAWSEGDRDAVRNEPVGGLDLGASLEAACWAATEQDASPIVNGWSQRCPDLRQALRGIGGRSCVKPEDHSAPLFELRRCPSRLELQSASDDGVEWRYFCDRFRRSLVEHVHLSSRTARALSAALHEMVDNVVEHAGLGNEPLGLVAYRLEEEGFRFAVADLGRGVLASLRENPSNAHITRDGEGLTAAVTAGASRRPGGRGTGFADLLRALADLDGLLFFRSGGARLRLDGRGRGDRVLAPSNTARMLGFQLSVCARPGKSSWSA